MYFIMHIRFVSATRNKHNTVWSSSCWQATSISFAALPGTRNLDPGYKLSRCVKIAMLYLEDDDPVSAELHIKKAATLIAQNSVSSARSLMHTPSPVPLLLCFWPRNKYECRRRQHTRGDGTSIMCQK
jgi:hypothetical protein